MYFLSLLEEVEIAAAVGFAGSVLFFTVSLNIGLAIACGALVSQAYWFRQSVRHTRNGYKLMCIVIIGYYPNYYGHMATNTYTF